jgi:hypothetical protein
MEQLVNMLKSLNTSELSENPMRKLTDQDHELVRMIQLEADCVLFAEDGEPAYERMDALFREHGFFVFPREGYECCIQTRKGIISFG